MIEAGRAALACAFLFDIACLYLAVRAARSRESGLRAARGEAAGRAWEMLFASLLLAAGALEVLLFQRDFRLAYVWQYTSSTLPALYTAASLWAGQAGSLLFWALLLAGYGVLARRFSLRREPGLGPGVLAVLAVIEAFFLVILLAIENPFATHWDVNPATPRMIPAEGMGLNPLLQHPAMAIHPPILYLGYIGTTIPFAFALAALATGRLGETWIRSTRKYVLAAWLFLGVGMLLGGRWAYEELGWGGYWAWDPVENAALVPWLIGTAFLHSVMIQERRGMLRVWNLVLVFLFFITAILGTFLTRTGLVTSVHAFARSDIMPPFAGLLILSTVSFLALLLRRLRELAPRERIHSLLSREAAFLFNNCVLVSMAFAVLWGTLFPVLSKHFTGEEIAVGPPFFNRVVLPMGVLLLWLAGLGTLLAWRRTTGERLARAFALPLASSGAAAAALYAAGLRHPLSLVALAGAVFLGATTFRDTLGAVRQRRAARDEGLGGLVRANPRRYGGYLVHLGLCLFGLGLVGNAYQVKESFSLAPGEARPFGGYEIRLEKIREDRTPHRTRVVADLSVAEPGRSPRRSAHPQVSLFFAGSEREQPLTEPAILSYVWGELYLVLLSTEGQGGGGTIEVYANPLVQWVFVGGFVMALGACFGFLSPRTGGPVAAPGAGAAVSAAFLVLMLGQTAAAAGPAAGAALGALGQNFFCLCGCAQTLATCPHPNCSELDTDRGVYGRKYLEADIAGFRAEGLSSDGIQEAMARKYGERVLTIPRGQGAGILAWVLPAMAFLLALTGVSYYLAVRRTPISEAPPAPISLTPEERARLASLADKEEEDAE